MNYLWKMRGYPQFSFWISIGLVKIYISCIITHRGKKHLLLVGTVLKYNSMKTAEVSATMNLQPIQGWLRSNFICFIKCQQLLRPLRHMCHVSSYISTKTNRSISFWRALNLHTELRCFAAQLCSNVNDEFQNTTSSLHQWQPAPGWRLIPWIQTTLSTQLEACPLHIWH